ncbi:MAG: sugar phosphate isomerase/epimerase family protein [Bacilli bacterium]
MKLSCIIENDFKDLEYFKSIGIENFELCTHENADEFFQNIASIKQIIKDNQVNIISLGRWGAKKIIDGQVCNRQLQIDFNHIKIANELGSKLFCTGINYDDELSVLDNYNITVNYFQKLIEYGKQYDVEIAVVNCDWNNYILGSEQWKILLGSLPELKIKYDPSHIYYRSVDYLKELEFLGDKVGHVHLKGCVKVDNNRFDDPPAGLDQIDWNSILTILYANNYDGYLSIEPHATKINRKITKKGVEYTYNYFAGRIMEND